MSEGDFFLRRCSQVRAQRVENASWSNVSMKSHRCWLRSELPCGTETWRSVVVTWRARFLRMRHSTAADSDRHRFKTNYVNPVSWIKHYLWLIRGLIQISRANRFNRVIKIQNDYNSCFAPPVRKAMLPVSLRRLADGVAHIRRSDQTVLDLLEPAFTFNMNSPPSKI